MMKLPVLSAALFLSSAPTRADNLPIHLIPRPPLIVRPIPVKPEFKNVVIRGIARQGNYSVATFLTNPDVRNDFNPSELSSQGQRLFEAFRSDVAAHQDNFNQNSLTALINDFAFESSGVDVEALAFIVLMEAAKGADSDLEAIMAAVKHINQAKQAIRDELALLNALAAGCHSSGPGCGGLSSAEIVKASATAKSDFDSLSEMSQLEQSRLQMIMDRQSKFIAALSNVLKKISDTSQSIVQNLK